MGPQASAPREQLSTYYAHVSTRVRGKRLSEELAPRHQVPHATAHTAMTPPHAAPTRGTAELPTTHSRTPTPTRSGSASRGKPPHRAYNAAVNPRPLDADRTEAGSSSLPALPAQQRQPTQQLRIAAAFALPTRRTSTQRRR